MYLLRKKDVLKELAISLYLVTEFDRDTTAHSVILRLRERARTALQASQTWTGPIRQDEVENFLKNKPQRFCIPLTTDVVRGDVIRFTELATDNCKRPPRHLGQRGIIAEVREVRKNGTDMMLHMQVISSGGAGALKPEELIKRPLKKVTGMEAVRAQWDDETKRHKSQPLRTELPQIKRLALAQILARQDKKGGL